ncbi:MAG: hypothetical protein ACLSE2_09625, partial [[Clostridium] symbiosum]
EKTVNPGRKMSLHRTAEPVRRTERRQSREVRPMEVIRPIIRRQVRPKDYRKRMQKKRYPVRYR